MLTGFLAAPSVNGNIAQGANPATSNGLADLVAHGMAWTEQLKAIGLTFSLAVVGTLLIGGLLRFLFALRSTAEAERGGLDVNEHGEEGYILEA